jgi:hypothetical protein
MNRPWQALVCLATVGWGPRGVISQQVRPSVLFCSPQGSDGGWVDLEYQKDLSLLHEIDADVTTDWALSPVHMNLTWARIQQYNVLVLFGEPAGIVASNFANQTKVPPGEGAAFPALVRRFMAAGGGVLMMPTELNKFMQQFPTLTATLGAIGDRGRWRQNTPLHPAYTLCFTSFER